MRKLVRDWVRLVAGVLPLPEPIVEFGSLQVEGMGELADLRPLFPGKRYLGTDLRPGPGVDCALDLHQVGLRDGCAGTALLLDTLEHVEYPRRAMAEVAREIRGQVVSMLRPGCAHSSRLPVPAFPHRVGSSVEVRAQRRQHLPPMASNGAVEPGMGAARAR